jgi:hypothetical protein
LKSLERVKGIEPSSSAWKSDAASTISEVITENEAQNRSFERKSIFSSSATVKCRADEARAHLKKKAAPGINVGRLRAAVERLRKK